MSLNTISLNTPRLLLLAWAAVLGLGLNSPSAPLFSQEGVQGNWSLNQPAAVPLLEPSNPRLAAAPDIGSPARAAGSVEGDGPIQTSTPSESRSAAANASPFPSALTGQNESNRQTEFDSAGGTNPDGAEKQASSKTLPNDPFISGLAQGAEALGATRLSGSFIQTALLLGALGLAPAILLMTTCYIRIMVVLGLLRQALGTTQLPPTQILMSLSMFLTILVMTPVWMEIKTQAFDPWSREENPISWEEAWNAGTGPLKQFMVRQIEICGNRSAVEVLYRHGKTGSAAIPPQNLAEAPLNLVLPAFILSELKVAFLLGFQIFLPFLILDLVVSTVTVSMGLAMLPPTMVSLPLKLILFVLVDGWNLVVGMLLQSFGGS